MMYDGVASALYGISPATPVDFKLTCWNHHQEVGTECIAPKIKQYVVKMVDVPHLTVPLADESDATIIQFPVDESAKTLGIWTNPAGTARNNLTSYMMLWRNGQTGYPLGNSLLNGPGSSINFGQKLRYGLGNNASPVKILH